MKLKLCCGLLFAVALASGFAEAETLVGDITAAVRDAGVAYTYSAAVGDVPLDEVEQRRLFAPFKIGERVLVARTTGVSESNPLVVTYTIPDDFMAGEDVVVTGVSFTAIAQDNPERKPWNFSIERLPTLFRLEGRAYLGAPWQTIALAGGCDKVPTINVNDDVGLLYEERHVPVCNWKSYREYRITILRTAHTDVVTDENPIQLGRICLHGLYGGKVVQPAPQFIDITAAVRAVDAAVTDPGVLVQEAGSTPFSALFNGDFSDRFLSDEASVQEAFRTLEGASFTYEADNSFARGADVVVTAYTLDVLASHGHAWSRMPRQWKFQGFDGENWVTLDSHDDFGCWAIVRRASADHYSFIFKFANSKSYRKYRFSIYRFNNVNEQGTPDVFEQVQFSEIQLWGYADSGIEGTVGLTAEPMDVNLGRTALYGGTLTCDLPLYPAEQDRASCAGELSLLFNGIFGDADGMFLRWLDKPDDPHLPCTVSIEPYADFFVGRELVLKSYTLDGNPKFGYYSQRMPRTWVLEGNVAKAGQPDDWRELDHRTEFIDWVEETDADNVRHYRRSFTVPEAARYACRAFRLKVLAINAKSKPTGFPEGISQLMLSEISLDGLWGEGIGAHVPTRPGMFLVFE